MGATAPPPQRVYSRIRKVNLFSGTVAQRVELLTSRLDLASQHVPRARPCRVRVCCASRGQTAGPAPIRCDKIMCFLVNSDPAARPPWLGAQREKIWDFKVPKMQFSSLSHEKISTAQTINNVKNYYTTDSLSSHLCSCPLCHRRCRHPCFRLLLCNDTYTRLDHIMSVFAQKVLRVAKSW